MPAADGEVALAFSLAADSRNERLGNGCLVARQSGRALLCVFLFCSPHDGPLSPHEDSDNAFASSGANLFEHRA